MESLLFCRPRTYYRWLFLAGDKKKGEVSGQLTAFHQTGNLFFDSHVPSLCGKRIAAGFIEPYHVQCPHVSNGTALSRDSAIIYHCDSRLAYENTHKFKGSEAVISVFHETSYRPFII